MEPFRFKQFAVAHDRCAMKVGTDGVLLGAWAKVDKGDYVLDVGTGCGVIALMLAQRGAGEVVGIDIDHDSIEQAKENVANSPFADRVSMVEDDVRTYAKMASCEFDVTAVVERLLGGTPTLMTVADDRCFDSIVSNPPFFSESTFSPNRKRARARSTAFLTLPVFFEACARMLRPGGSLQIIVPTREVPNAKGLALLYGLSMKRRTEVYTVEGKESIRTLLHFCKDGCFTSVRRHSLTLFTADGQMTKPYHKLVKDFYLDKADE